MFAGHHLVQPRNAVAEFQRGVAEPFRMRRLNHCQ